MARPEKRIMSILLSDPDSSGSAPAREERVLGIDALRHAVRTQPAEEWYLTTASKAMYGTHDYDQVRAKTGGYSWRFTGEVLDELVSEGLLHRPDGIRYVPTPAARRTWPATDGDFADTLASGYVESGEAFAARIGGRP